MISMIIEIIDVFYFFENIGTYKKSKIETVLFASEYLMYE